MVFNKVDNYRYEAKDEDDLTPKTRENISLEELQQTWMARNDQLSVFISAKKKQNIEQLKNILFQEVRMIHMQRYPYEQHPAVYFHPSSE